MLRSDLHALRNLFRTGEGRAVLLAQSIVVVCIVVGSVALAGSVFLQEELLETIRNDSSGVAVRSYYALTLVLPLAMVLGIGVTGSNAELFRAPQLPTLLTAPIRSWAIVGHGFLRAGFGLALYCLAIGVPPVYGLADRTELPLTPILVYPVAASLFVAPVLAAQCALKVILVRWCSGPRMRLLFLGLNLSFLTGLALAAGFGLVQGADVASWLGEFLQEQDTLPWFLDAPAGLLALAAGLEPGRGVWTGNLILLLLPLPFLGLGAALYRSAVEAHWVAGATTTAARARAARRDWPAHPLRSLLRKSMVESLRVRSNIIGYVFVVFLMVLILAVAGEVSPAAHDKTPRVLSEVFHAWLPWQGMVLLLASISFLAVIGEEQKQAGLLSMAPLPRRVFLRSKILSIAAPFALCIGIVIVAAPGLQGMSAAAVALFMLAAVPIVFFTLGLLAMVGTWPTFTRLHGDVPLANSVRSVVPVLVIGGGMTAVMLGLIKLRHAIGGCYNGRGPFAGMDPTVVGCALLAGLWVVGLGAFAVFHRVGLRNVERLLGPQPE